MIFKSERKTETADGSLKYIGLQHQPDTGKSRGRIYQAIRRFLREQFGRPAGVMGNIVGMIMARTPSNRDRLHWTLSLLDIRPDDRLLEIGFGPGLAIEAASRIATKGFVEGIDHSGVMVRQASRRNSQAIRAGKVILRHGSASDLPEFREQFDKIFTINSIHFWDDPVGSLMALRTLLKPGGVIAVTLQPRSRDATDETTKEIGKEVLVNLERAGFSQVRLEIGRIKPVSVACAMGIR